MKHSKKEILTLLEITQKIKKIQKRLIINNIFYNLFLFKKIKSKVSQSKKKHLVFGQLNKLKF